MKTIYVPIDGKVYRVNQDTHIPSTMCTKQPGFSSSLTKDPDNSTIIQSIDINAVVGRNYLSRTNGELYQDLLALLREKRITEIPVIKNTFKIYVDYSLFVDNKETERSAVVKPITSTDSVLPLGCAENNELVYRRVADLKATVSFKIRNSLPYGVVNQRKQNFKVQINSICVFQDFAPYAEHHYSAYDVPYPIGSRNINSALDTCVLMFSTDADGVSIQPVEVNFAPRVIEVDINVILGHMVVAFDNKEVDDIVRDNINRKYRQDDPIPPCPPPFPPQPYPYPSPQPYPYPDPYRPADGDDNPDDHGRSDWYERATATNPGALLVVEDRLDAELFDPDTMIHRWKVVRDIPDIELGEYVIYREGFDASLS